MSVMDGWQMAAPFYPLLPLPVPPCYVFCLYPTATSRLSLLNLHNWLGLKLQQSKTNWTFFLDCPEAKDNCSVLPNADAILLPRDLSQFYLNQQIYRLVEDSVFPGTVILLPGRQFLTLAFAHLQFFGWKTIIIHPTNYVSMAPANEMYPLPPELEEDEPTDYLSLDPDSFKSKCLFPELSFPEFLGHVLPSSNLGIETLLTCIDVPRVVTGPLPPTLPVYFGKSDKDDTEDSMSTSESEEEETSELESEEAEEEQLQPLKKTVTLADVCRAAAYKPSPPRPPVSSPSGFTLVERKKNKSPKTSPKKEGKTAKKVVKYAPQCPMMTNKEHKQTRCSYWHPKKQCEYYPKCYSGAEECGYGHPFCVETGSCVCPTNSRDRQMNHRVLNSRSKTLIDWMRSSTKTPIDSNKL